MFGDGSNDLDMFAHPDMRRGRDCAPELRAVVTEIAGRRDEDTVLRWLAAGR